MPHASAYSGLAIMPGKERLLRPGLWRYQTIVQLHLLFSTNGFILDPNRSGFAFISFLLLF